LLKFSNYFAGSPSNFNKTPIGKALVLAVTHKIIKDVKNDNLD